MNFGENKKQMSDIEIKDQIIELEKKARLLEIELDYVESKEPNNYYYTRKLENKIDKIYEEIDELGKAKNE